MSTFRVSYDIKDTKFIKYFTVPDMINSYSYGPTKNRLKKLFQNMLECTDVDIEFVSDKENTTGQATVEWCKTASDYKIVGVQGWIRESSILYVPSP